VRDLYTTSYKLYTTLQTAKAVEKRPPPLGYPFAIPLLGGGGGGG
jgi:hypothetical protein